MRKFPFALAIFLCGAPEMRGDSGEVTTISAKDDALSRSASPQSLSTVMPNGPPGYSSAGMPVERATVAPAATPESDAAPVPAASSAPVMLVAPAPEQPVVILDSRDSPGKLVVGRGKRKTAVHGGALLVDRHGRRLEIVPAAVLALNPISVTPTAESSVTMTLDGEARENSGRRIKAWHVLLGASAVVLVVALALR